MFGSGRLLRVMTIGGGRVVRACRTVVPAAVQWWTVVAATVASFETVEDDVQWPGTVVGHYRK